MTSEYPNRRDFLGASAAVAASWAAPSVSLAQGSNDTIQIGVIGPGGRGTELLKECIEFGSNYNARVTAVCDIWKQRLAAAAQRVRESYSAEPKQHDDYRDMLADDEIDAVIIATPDHQDAQGLRRSRQARVLRETLGQCACGSE